MKLNREQFREMLATARARNDHRLMERGILVLYALQTDDEQKNNVVRKNNNCGFSKKTNEKGSYIARWLLRGKRVSRQYIEIGYRICYEHSGQLASVATKGSTLRNTVDNQMKEWNSKLHPALRRQY